MVLRGQSPFFTKLIDDAEKHYDKLIFHMNTKAGKRPEKIMNFVIDYMYCDGKYPSTLLVWLESLLNPP